MAAWPHYSGKQVQDFFIRTTNGMAIGLFGTLSVGTFVKIPGLEIVGVFANVIKGLMSAGIGVGVTRSCSRRRASRAPSSSGP